MVGYEIISITGGEGSDFTVKVNDKDYGYTATISSTSLTLKTFEFTDEKLMQKLINDTIKAYAFYMHMLL